MVCVSTLKHIFIYGTGDSNCVKPGTVQFNLKLCSLNYITKYYLSNVKTQFYSKNIYLDFFAN
jgi:hypothetical protein